MPGTAYQSRTRHFCGEWGTSPFKYRGFVTNTRRTQNTDEFEVYPNPASGRLYISLSSIEGVSSPVQIEIMNTLGQVVFSKAADLEEMMTPIELNIGNLSVGNYLMKITNGDTVKTRPVFIR